MKRLATGVLSATFLIATAGVCLAKGPLSSTGLEEAFVDAAGTCGPSSGRMMSGMKTK